MLWQKVWCSHSACCTCTLANHFSMLLMFHLSPCMVHWLHTYVLQNLCIVLPEVPSQSPSAAPSTPSTSFQTQPNSGGMICIYPTQPTQIPDLGTTGAHSNYIDAPMLASSNLLFSNLLNIVASSNITCDNLFLAFSSPTASLLMCWQYLQSTAKSKDELNRLWKYIKDPTFNPQEQLDFSHDRKWKWVGKYLEDDMNPFHAQHGWFCSSFNLLLIKENIWYTSEDDPSIPIITIKNLYHRSIVDIMKSVFSEKVSLTFHMLPFEEFWTTTNGHNIWVYSETYMFSHILDTYREINSNLWEDGNNYKQIIAPLMLWSDATQLSHFGDASLWPVYLYFGNQSKYTWGKPTSGTYHHIAYIPSVSVISSATSSLLILSQVTQ